MQTEKEPHSSRVRLFFVSCVKPSHNIRHSGRALSDEPPSFAPAYRSIQSRAQILRCSRGWTGALYRRGIRIPPPSGPGGRSPLWDGRRAPPQPQRAHGRHKQVDRQHSGNTKQSPFPCFFPSHSQPLFFVMLSNPKGENNTKRQQKCPGFSPGHFFKTA